MTAWLTLIGIGEDGLDGLSSAAKLALEQAEFVVGGARHLALAGSLEAETLVWPSPIEGGYTEILRRKSQRVVVLASGDPFFYGVGSVLAQHVPAEQMICHAQPSSISLAAGRLGWAVQDCAIISLHGRALERLVPHLHPARKILALSWDGTTPQKIARLLVARGLGASTLTILQRLGGKAEKQFQCKAAEFALEDIDPLNIVAIEVAAVRESRILPFAAGLPDDWFQHDGQITKRDIRAVTLAALEPCHGQLLWDIGAGSGSISIEWMLRDTSLRAIAFEQHPLRVANIHSNAAALGVPDLQIVTGAAPAVLAGHSAPDAVFIGGGSTAEGVFDAAWAALKPGGRMVINAVTLEAQVQLIALFQKHGGRLTQLSFAEADAVGRFHGWRAAMPVVQWQVRK